MTRSSILLSTLTILTLPLHAEESADTAVETIELDTIVVSAPLQQKQSESARPVTVLEKEELLTKNGNSIGQTLQQELGMNNQSFGAGVGAPVIRGQAGPRVRVLQNGLGTNDASTLSPDHANSVEPVLTERIEILRGPATLLYGSGAIGGVVNVLDNRIPESFAEKAFGFEGLQRFDSVSDESSSTLKIDGGKSHLAYHLDGFYREHGNLHIGGEAIDEAAARATDSEIAKLDTIQNSHGVINNTQAHAIGGTAGLSYVADDGFAGVSINRLENTYGIPPDGADEEPIRIDLKQSKYDFKTEWRQPFAHVDAFRMKFGYTDYRHVELEGGTPGTTWTSQAYESRLEVAHQPLGPLAGVVGFQSINSDFAAFGAEAIVPKSQIDTYALFAVESFNIGSVTYELGARVEHQSIAPEGRKMRNDLPVSGSASALWKINDQHQLSMAVTQSQRAPQVQELYSNGPHFATRSFDIGNQNLKKEVSYNLDLGYRFKHDWIQAEFNLFHNWVNNYIYLQHTGAVDSGVGFPILQSSQNDAIFKGYESKLMLTLMENRYGLVDLTLFSDYTRGQFVSGADVPRMPPLRYGFQLDYHKAQWAANIRLTRGEAQNNPGEHESPTTDYLLLGIGAQYQVTAFDKTELTFFAKGNNLLNENIRNSTSYLRNFAPEPGRGAEIGMRLSY